MHDDDDDDDYETKTMTNKCPLHQDKGTLFTNENGKMASISTSYMAELGLELVIPGSAVKCATNCATEHRYF